MNKNQSLPKTQTQTQNQNQIYEFKKADPPDRPIRQPSVKKASGIGAREGKLSTRGYETSDRGADPHSLVFLPLFLFLVPSFFSKGGGTQKRTKKMTKT
ncbi:hypothetical protein SERLA73DRAFT_187177 [Serpula lacrymans var. lacrymans S7.3]|uniref:Uncharacterized protein n=1 Tax=Serpula lacrymans var. lacrymans (strain S7.3) TaxID=936435 RepID=F8Q8L6_SERL3|nr:hypothetical protein SERLA73DRAFT_187177 [Serpula lacrymans var. lacrymans S7.3]